MNMFFFKRIGALALLLWLTVLHWSARAQSASDAFQFSSITATGTARSLGMGGAMTAVGGDMTALTLNPAGLGLYRKGEITLSPGLRFIGNNTSYIGQTGSANRTNFGFANLGGVLVTPREAVNSSMGLKSINIAFGFNQQNNFHRNTEVSAFNRFNTISDYFAFIGADGVSFGELARFDSPFRYERAAFRAYMIDTAGTGSASLWLPATAQARMQQTIRYEERGRTNHWALGVGLNFGDRVYAGASLGFMDYSYRYTSSHTEEDINGVYQGVDTTFFAPVRRIDFLDEVVYEGSGINFGLGIIVQVTDNLRVGLSGSTPTWSTFRVDFAPEASTQMYFAWNGLQRHPGTNNVQAGTVRFSYASAWTGRLGAVYTIKKWGLVTADVGLVAYGTESYGNDPSDFNGSGADYSGVNAAIRDIGRTAYHYQLGAEGRPLKNWYLRAGYGYFEGPRKQEFDNLADLGTYESADGTATVRRYRTDRYLVSGGIGYRTAKIRIDLAYVWQRVYDRFLQYPTPTIGAFLDPLQPPGSRLVVLPFSDGVNNGGLGAGVAPIVEQAISSSNFVLTLGIPISR